MRAAGSASGARGEDEHCGWDWRGARVYRRKEGTTRYPWFLGSRLSQTVTMVTGSSTRRGTSQRPAAGTGGSRTEFGEPLALENLACNLEARKPEPDRFAVRGCSVDEEGSVLLLVIQL